MDGCRYQLVRSWFLPVGMRIQSDFRGSLMIIILLFLVGLGFYCGIETSSRYIVLSCWSLSLRIFSPPCLLSTVYCLLGINPLPHTTYYYYHHYDYDYLLPWILLQCAATSSQYLVVYFTYLTYLVPYPIAIAVQYLLPVLHRCLPFRATLAPLLVLASPRLAAPLLFFSSSLSPPRGPSIFLSSLPFLSCPSPSFARSPTQ
ncbi:hypothetical protein BO71DRAFT_214082 [Aspergillus ellipticus CBS 707.79]|uniref:Uncharacterized protein n=1 Tax=Aspergillus ellipticus CBS 707.79 TaxID=1448320 RepID=A0A319EUR1_9EURO|nr:hypothetical protein BO71DRAFT_214082 [Aspergillus ellipticus CBS 707.79]